MENNRFVEVLQKENGLGAIAHSNRKIIITLIGMEYQYCFAAKKNTFLKCFKILTAYGRWSF